MSNFASFLVGMGGGYIKARDKEYDRARQEKEDAYREEQRGILRTEQQDKANLKSDMQNALNPVSTGYQVTDAAGSNAFSKDADAASMMSDMSAAKNTGTQMQNATRVESQVLTDPTKIAEATNLATTPDAESLRVQGVYRKTGNRAGLMSEVASNEDAKQASRERIKKLETEGVANALGLLRAGSPEQAMAAFQTSGSMKLPEGSKFVQVAGTDMFTGKPGKVWSVVGPQGKTIVGDVGQSAARYLGIADQINLNAKVAGTKQTQANYELSERKLTMAEQQAAAREARMNDGGGGHGGSAGGTGTGGGMAGSVGLKDRRDMLSDYSKLLPAADETNPESATTTLASNTKALQQADAIFSMNAGFGSVMTAPQVRAAQQLAQDAKNVKLVRDNETGKTYQTVTVNGSPFIVGLAAEKSAQVEKAAPATAMTGKDNKPPAPPIKPKAEPIQLLQPFYNMNAWRKRIQEETNANLNQ